MCTASQSEAIHLIYDLETSIFKYVCVCLIQAEALVRRQAHPLARDDAPTANIRYGLKPPASRRTADNQSEIVLCFQFHIADPNILFNSPFPDAKE
jgi:hypothetical protein